jgi:hypothetical protein
VPRESAPLGACNGGAQADAVSQSCHTEYEQRPQHGSAAPIPGRKGAFQEEFCGARWNRTIGLSIIRETVTPFMTSHNARIEPLNRGFIVRGSASDGLVGHHSCRPSRRNRGAALPVPTTDLSLSYCLVAIGAGVCPRCRGARGAAATLRVLHVHRRHVVLRTVYWTV